jgi:hypothetical protein
MPSSFSHSVSSDANMSTQLDVARRSLERESATIEAAAVVVSDA